MIQRALTRQASDASFRVILVLLPSSDTDNVDDFLELRTWLDFRNGIDDSDALHRLVCGVRGIHPGRESTG